MEDKILVVFDDTNEKSDVIKDITGNRGFGDVIVKKHTLASYCKDSLGKMFPDFSFVHVHSFFEFNDLLKEMENMSESARILHFFSRYVISDAEKSSVSLKKLHFIEKTYRAVFQGKTAALLFKSARRYGEFLKNALREDSTQSACAAVDEHFEIEGLIDIGIVGNFIQVVAGNFDARYFNSLKGDEYTLVKSSANKKKIKAEYTFYHLLPEDMKPWFVMPFNYREDEKSASYTMERLHTTDLAIKWVHGSVDRAEFSEILDKYFYFFKSRHSKEISRQEYEKTADELYVQKAQSRLSELKSLGEFEKIAALMQSSCAFKTIEEIFEKYLSLKAKIESQNKYPSVSVIGHGDPCFANVMYNKSMKLLKFIDPKGALTEADLWTNPYYDIAKLSHSVCGNYDFFNNALFDIYIGEDFRAELKIAFDNSAYKEIFRKKLEENGFDYLTVRVYEASLFLSMLPLHIDNPHKVFGFILNAIHILEEIENEI